MRSTQLSRQPWSVLFVASLVVMALGVFWLPYWIPNRTDILSGSALAGFNNSVAYIWFLLMLGPPAALLTRLSPVRWSGETPSTERRVLTVGSVFGAVTSGYVAVLVAIYLAKHGFVFAESLYFQDLLYRMAWGQRPFVDVNFFYGPAMLYPAHWLVPGLGLNLAYGVTLVVTSVVGLYCLFVAVGALTASRSAQEFWFTVLAIGLFNPFAGLNYTLLRPTLPVVALLAVWWSVRTTGMAAMAISSSLLFLAFLYSPEIGLVTLIAVAVFMTVFVVRRLGTGQCIEPVLRPVVSVTLGLIGAAFSFWLMDPSFFGLSRYVAPLITFSGGGWNTTIDPSLPMLGLLTQAVIGGALVWRMARSAADPSIGSFWSAFGIMALLMLRSPFGKADVLHIAYSGIPLFLLVPTALESSRRLGRVAAAAVLCVIVGLQAMQLIQFAPVVADRLVSPRPPDRQLGTPAPQRPQDLRSDLEELVRYFGDDQLYYMHKLEYYRLPVYQKFQLRPFLFHPSLTSAFTADDIESVINALRESRAVVVARRPDLQRPSAATSVAPAWLQFMLSCPLPGSTVFDLTVKFQWMLERPLVEFLKTEYDIGWARGDLVGLVSRRD